VVVRQAALVVLQKRGPFGLSQMLCTQCNGELHRSHRQGMAEMLASTAGMYPYRCPKCETRSLRFRVRVPTFKPARRSPVEREIKLTRAQSRKRRTRREFLLYGTGILFFLGFLYFITRERSGSCDGN
jgi:hypothetical protein